MKTTDRPRVREADPLEDNDVKRLSISYRVIMLIMLCALIAALAPMLIAAQYDAASADDLSFGARAHLAYANTGSALAAIAAAAEEARIAYSTWQGSFSAIFLMALQPGVFAEGLYAATPWIMLISLTGGVFLICRAVLTGLMTLARECAYIAASLILILCTQLLPSPVQGFYWYNGAVYYTFFFGVTLAASALGGCLVRRGGSWRGALLTLLCAFIGGGNYVTALAAAIVCASALLLGIILRDRRCLRFIAPLAALLAALIISAAAPGNAVRQADYANTPGALGAVALSFIYGARYCAEWMSLPLAASLIFLAPLITRAARRSRFAFRFPALVSAWSFCLLSAMFCPPLYAMNNVGDMRLTNIIFFAYVILCVFNLTYWTGWLVRRRGDMAADSPRAGAAVTALTAALVAGCCLISMRGGQCFTSVSALSSLRSGEAAAYRAECEARWEILNDGVAADVQLPPLVTRPYILYYDDITGNADDWRNLAAARFYNKSSVVLISEEEA